MMRHPLDLWLMIAAAVLVAMTVGACKNINIEPPDRSLDIPSWCEPYGCQKGGG